MTLGAGGAALLLGASPGAVAVASFAAVIGAALMISFGAESAQFFVSQGLAVAIIALLQITPEFVVEGTIAYQGNVDLMLANFTGSNRLLMGVGWPLIYGTAAYFHRRRYGRPLRDIRLRPEAVIEILALLVPSLYFLIVLEKGSFTIADAVVLAMVFVVYMFLLGRLPAEGKESMDDLVTPSRRIVQMPPRRAKGFIVLLFVVGGVLIMVVAKQFVDSLKVVAVSLGISTFVFIQWVAPFLSEFPEKVSAFYWAKRIKLAPMALLNMISSKVNQWTLLVLFIPTFYSLGQGTIASVPLSEFQKLELLLSIAMTVYGATTLLKRRFKALDASILFGLWLLQFVFPETLPGTPWDTRLLTAVAFGGLAGIELFRHRREIHILADLRDSLNLMLRKREATFAGPAPAHSPDSD